MKQKILLTLTIFFFLQSSCMELFASEENAPLLLDLPEEIIKTIAQDFDCATIASLKCSCNALKQNIGYRHLPKTLIENEDYDKISDGLISTAHQNEKRDHKALRFNNPKQREESLALLGWNAISSTTESMNAYRGVPAQTQPKPLENAIHKNTLVFKILSLSVNPNIQDTMDCTALHWACCEKNANKVQQLLKNKNINPNTQNYSGNTALHLGCSNTTALLLAHPDTNPNIQSTQGHTALHVACICNETKTVALLLAHPKTNPNILTNEGYTALDHAWIRSFERSDSKMLELLQANGARHSWKFYIPHTLGATILALLFSYCFYKIVQNSAICLPQTI